VVREGWGQGGEMNQSLYAHMNNKRKMKKKRIKSILSWRHSSEIDHFPKKKKKKRNCK
jgi:hypothetical protein